MPSKEEIKKIKPKPPKKPEESEMKKSPYINREVDTMENQEQTKETTKIAEQKYNKLAIFGLILSIIAVFGVGLAGIVGFILGIVALVQIKHTHEKGRGLAIVAIIVGFIWSFGIGILRRLVGAGF